MIWEPAPQVAAFIVGSVRDVIQNLCFYGEKLEVGGSLSFVLGVDFIAIACLSFFYLFQHGCFLSCLARRSHSTSFWISLGGN